jgi:non-canonical poly(A) RNA polymerase PAPD5/7
MTESKRDNEQGWKDDDFLAFVAPKASDDLSESEDEEEEVVTNIISSSQLPPWMDHSVDTNKIYPLVSLHNEIVDFVHLMEPMSEEVRQREKLIQEVKDVVQSLFGSSADVQVFGSQATGLLLPTSDIDIVIITQTKSETVEVDEEHTWEQPVSTPLRRFADELQATWIDRLSYLEAIENTRIPLVKFTDKKSNISVDVSFDQPSGPPAAVLMKTYLNAMPVLRPLTFVLKYFLAARSLNEPYSGGVGSFMLQLLIVAFLQHRERLAFNYRKQTVYNLGLLLVEFFKFYGLDFNYFTTVISVRNDGFFFPKGERKEVFCDDGRTNLLALENPLDPSSDVGKPSFRFQMVRMCEITLYLTCSPVTVYSDAIDSLQVQRAFALAYRTLMAHVLFLSSRRTRSWDPFCR